MDGMGREDDGVKTGYMSTLNKIDQYCNPGGGLVN